MVIDLEHYLIYIANVFNIIFYSFVKNFIHLYNVIYLNSKPQSPSTTQKTSNYISLQTLCPLFIIYEFIYFKPLSQISASHVCPSVWPSKGT